MLDSIRLYRASPEAFFSALDSRLKEIDDQIENLRNQVTGISDVADAFVRNLPVKFSEVPAPTRWTYLAELPNLYFEDVFEPESKGIPLRWVGKSGRLSWLLKLPRSVQYDLSIHCIDFSSPEMRESFCLNVGKTKYPWLATDDGIFKTIVLESDIEDDLAIEISVSPDTILAGSDVTFSFAKIEISRRG